MEPKIVICKCENKCDKFEVGTDEDTIQIYIYGRTDTAEPVIRIKDNNSAIPLLTVNQTELQNNIYTIQKIISDAVETDIPILVILKDGEVLSAYDSDNPEELLTILQTYSPHLYSTETPKNWFVVSDSMINSEGYLFCPHCGRRYKRTGAIIERSKLPSTYTACRKCGTDIMPVHRWQDAICQNEQCLKEHKIEMEIKNENTESIC